MTIAVIWPEDGYLWCAADTRLVAGKNDDVTTEIAAKIYSIPVIASAMAGSNIRQPHFSMQYGFVYAGASAPASMTAITAATFLQKLARPGGRTEHPTFEQIAEFVHRLASRFMTERRRFGADGIFSGALFGWCSHSMQYKIAHIDGRTDCGFRVELSYPPRPETDGDPWLVLGSGASKFAATLAEYRATEMHIKKRLPRRVIDKMVAEELDGTVGGAISISAAHEHGFELFYAIEPVVPGQPAARRIFNGLDLDTEVGQVGEYIVAATGIA